MVLVYQEELSSVIEAIGAEYVLGVWETGSRAYEFSHKQSDADLTIIYTLPKVAYVLENEVHRNGFNTEQVDISFNQDVEFEGWDIRRFRKLLFEFDPMVYETLLSPVSYVEPAAFKTIKEEMKQNPNPIPLFKQYQSSAEHIYKQRKQNGRITQKYLFHIVRNQLMAEYIRQEHKYPTLKFNDFLTECPQSVFSVYSKNEVLSLLEAKQSSRDSTKVVDIVNETSLQSFFKYELDYDAHIPDNPLDKTKIDNCITELVENERASNRTVFQ